MKKNFKNIITIFILLVAAMFVGASTVYAAESITIGKVWKVNGINFRNTTDGKEAYCMNKNKKGPKKGESLTLVATHTKGIYVYILNNTDIAGTDANKSRTIKQKALWKYDGTSISGSYANEANKLVQAAINAGSEYEINPTIVSITNPGKFTREGAYYISENITVEMKDVAGDKYTVSFEGAPEGTEVTNQNGLTFQVKVPVSSVTKSTTFTIKVTGAESSYKYVEQYQKNSKYQNMAVTYSESKTPTITTTAKIDHKVCSIDGTTYYGKDGKIVDETTYNSECNPTCEVQDGVYYDSKGNEVTEEQFNKDCNPTCEVQNGVYYDSNGNKVTKEQFNKECNPVCTVENGVYYDSKGNKVTKEKYNKDCNPTCEVQNGVYYDSKGNKVTKEKFNKDCNPTCKIVDGKYYDKNGNQVTKSQYKNDCEAEVVPVPDTGSKASIASIAVGSMMILGGAGAVLRYKKIGL